jgi:hypothetical protein
MSTTLTVISQSIQEIQDEISMELLKSEKEIVPLEKIKTQKMESLEYLNEFVNYWKNDRAVVNERFKNKPDARNFQSSVRSLKRIKLEIEEFNSGRIKTIQNRITQLNELLTIAMSRLNNWKECIELGIRNGECSCLENMSAKEKLLRSELGICSPKDAVSWKKHYMHNTRTESRRGFNGKNRFERLEELKRQTDIR